MDIVQVIVIGLMLALGSGFLAILVHYAKQKNDNKKEK